MSTTHLLYLHGFRSSPCSVKAQQMAARIQRQHPEVVWWCPQLPPSPREAIALIDKGIATWPRGTMAVMGSSLGGFYATWVVHQMHCKAVLLNPAVQPARDLARYIGEQTAWHSPEDRFFFKPEFIGELKALECPATPSPAEASRLMAVIAKCDEVLDWREMTARYPHAHIKLLDEGDHALSDFDDHIEEILAFLDLG